MIRKHFMFNFVHRTAEKLSKLQGRAARAITGESYEVRSTDI